MAVTVRRQQSDVEYVVVYDEIRIDSAPVNAEPKARPWWSRVPQPGLTTSKHRR